MHPDTPLTPWTRDELKAHAYVTAQQMRTPSTWDDEPWDDIDLAPALALIHDLFGQAGMVIEIEVPA